MRIKIDCSLKTMSSHRKRCLKNPPSKIHTTFHFSGIITTSSDKRLKERQYCTREEEEITLVNVKMTSHQKFVVY